MALARNKRSTMERITNCCIRRIRSVAFLEFGSVRSQKEIPALCAIAARSWRQSAMTTSNTVLDLIDAFRRSKTMFAAVELGIFDGHRPADAKELARLLEACASLGLLEKRGEEYVNTPEADKFLRSDSPDTLTGYIRYSNNALYPMWGHLEDAVREGTHRWKQTFGWDGPIFSHFFRSEGAMREFQQGMHGFGRLSSPAVVAAFDLSRFH